MVQIWRNPDSRSDASEDVPDLGEDVDAENDEDIEDEPQGVWNISKWISSIQEKP